MEIKMNKKNNNENTHSLDDFVIRAYQMGVLKGQDMAYKKIKRELRKELKKCDEVIEKDAETDTDKFFVTSSKYGIQFSYNKVDELLKKIKLRSKQ